MHDRSDALGCRLPEDYRSHRETLYTRGSGECASSELAKTRVGHASLPRGVLAIVIVCGASRVRSRVR